MARTLEQVRKEETAQKIFARFQHAESFCRPWHNRIREWRNLYNMHHYSVRNPRPTDNLYPDPTPTNTVDTAVGILSSEDIEFRATGWQSSASEEKITSKAEKFLRGVIEISNDREGYYIPYEVNMHFVRDGCAVLYTAWDVALASLNERIVQWPDPNSETGVSPRRLYVEPPIRVQVIDPLKIYLLPGGPKRWGHVFRVEQMSVAEVEAAFGITVDSTMNDLQKIMEKRRLIDYWWYEELMVPKRTDEGQPVFNEVLQEPELEPRWVVFNAVLYENKMIREPRPMPGYTDIPYKIQFFKPVDRDNPKDWGHSILAPQESTVRFLEYAINRRMRQIDIFTNLPLVVKSIGGRTVIPDPGFENIVTIGPDENIAFAEWPGNAPDVQEHINFLRSRLQQSGFSEFLFGVPTDNSGYALSQISDQNRIRLQQPVRHLEMLWSQWAKQVLDMVDNFAANSIIRVYGRLKGTEFAEQVIGGEVSQLLVRAIIKPRFPNDAVRKHAMATQAAGVLSQRTLLERYYDIEQPDEERRRKLAELAQEQPAMLQYAAFAALMELAAEGDMAAALTIQQMQAGGIGGQRGRPPEPRAPEQAVGLPSPTGELTPQEQGQPAPGQDFLSQITREVLRAPNLQGEV